jgi:hypothetical protein
MNEESPWMLPTMVFEWIEKNIAFGSTILEFGSGEGSKRLSLNYQLYSVEHNPEWLRSSNGICLYAPIKLSNEFPGEIGWYDLSSVKEELPNKIDLMIIDGPNGSIGRSGILANTDSFSWEFPVLIDDLHREREYQFSQQLSYNVNLECVHFDSTGSEAKGSLRSFGVFQRK